MSGENLLHLDANGNELLRIELAINRVSFVSSDKGFITAQDASTLDGHVVRYDSMGQVKWDRLIDMGIWRNRVKDAIAFDDGMFGHCGRHQDVTGSGAVIRKLCPNGGIIWTEVWNLDESYASHATEMFEIDAGLYVIGNADAGLLGTGFNRNLMLTRHDFYSGTLEWSYPMLITVVKMRLTC